MSTIGSNTTLEELFAAYDDNASYFEDDSVPKAKAFITACTMLLMRVPKRERTGGNNETEFNPSEIRMQLEYAKRWLSQKRRSSGGHRHISLRHFRG